MVKDLSEFSDYFKKYFNKIRTSNWKEIFRQRVEEKLKVKKWSKYRLARETGINKNLVHLIFRKDRRFNEDQLIAISKAFETPPYNLLSDEELIPKSMLDLFIDMLKRKPNEISIPFFKIDKASNIIENIEENKDYDFKYFDESLLKKRSVKLFAMNAFDNSMSPTINKGDFLIFDKNEKQLSNPISDNIYLLKLPDPAGESGIIEFVLGRIILKKSEKTTTIVILPENLSYQKIFLEDIKNEELQKYFFGLCIWIGKSLKIKKK